MQEKRFPAIIPITEPSEGHASERSSGLAARPSPGSEPRPAQESLPEPGRAPLGCPNLGSQERGAVKGRAAEHFLAEELKALF